MKPGTLIGPIILIGIGMVFLAANFVPGFSVDFIFTRLWPFFLIGLGVILLVKSILAAPFRGQAPNLVGPGVMIALGSLFALNEFTGVGFDRTWPVLLVVIGLLILLSRLSSPFRAPWGRR